MLSETRQTTPGFLCGRGGADGHLRIHQGDQYVWTESTGTTSQVHFTLQLERCLLDERRRVLRAPSGQHGVPLVGSSSHIFLHFCQSLAISGECFAPLCNLREASCSGVKHSPGMAKYATSSDSQRRLSQESRFIGFWFLKFLD